MNMDLEKIKTRSVIVKLIRRWFDERGFLEMHTPRLVGLPGQEPHLDPFWTEVFTPSLTAHRSSFPAALITSPEYMMKRLLAEGLDKIYDLGPCFRNNEPWDGTHDPEFLMLEWYRCEAGLEDLMCDTEEMIRFVFHELRATGYTLRTEPFRRLTVEEAWREYSRIELAPLLENREAMAKVVKEHNQTVLPGDSWDDLFFKIFLSEIEPCLGKKVPTFLYCYPANMAALARKSVDDPRWAERVELYIGDFELANGFAELSDSIEQRARFEEERILRHKLGKKIWNFDERFLSSLSKMGNAAGMAFGVDRLVMLLTGAKSINEILPESARERFEEQLLDGRL